MEELKGLYPYHPYKSERLKEYAIKYGVSKEFPRFTRVYNSGEVFVFSGYIEQGGIRVGFYDSNGEEQIRCICGKDTFIGDFLAWPGEKSICYGETYAYTVVYQLEPETFQRLFDEDKLFRDEILQSIKYKVLQMYHLITEAPSLSNKQRLIQLLTNGINPQRVYQDGFYYLRENYSKKELAAILGLSRITITKLLQELEEEGWIMMNQRQIYVKQK